MPPAAKPYRFTYAAKDFRSGLTVGFEIYDISGTLHVTGTCWEIADTGVYTQQVDLPKGHYICRISEPAGFWRAYQDIIIE